jgi:hypothetical protein
MDSFQIETVLHNMGGLLLKLSEATSLLLEEGTANLRPQLVGEQRGKAEEIRRAAASLRGALDSLGPNQ